MQLKEIESSLPNGFHDALLKSFNIDFALRKLSLTLRLCTGDPDAVTQDERESYKEAELVLSGFVYLVVDPPDQKYNFQDTKELWIDAGESKPGISPPLPIPIEKLPNGTFAYWFFIRDWNSFIHVAAQGANLHWA